MNTIVLPYPYTEIFEDAARVFAAEEGEDTLVFGLAPWIPVDIQELKSKCQGRLIAYQSEPLSESNFAFCASQVYMDRLKQCDEVWDYSEHNLQYLKSHGVDNVKYVPVVPSAILKSAPMEQDIDILHVGGLTWRRRWYLNALIGRGYEVYDVKSQHKRAVHREEMHQLYCRSRVVLGLHAYMWSHTIQESFRYQYPLSNGVTVLAEKSLSNPLGVEEFANMDELLALLQKYVQPKQHDEDWYPSNYIFSAGETDLDWVGRMDDKWQCVEYAECMLADARAAQRLRQAKHRQDEVRIANACLFRDCLYMLRIVMLNEVGLDEGQRKMLYGWLKEVYTSLHRPPLRKILLATGGLWWPRLRCAMQLSGWTALRATMRLFLMMRAVGKYISTSMVMPQWDDATEGGSKP